jgi:pantoate--beta-alanine ligase
MQGYCEVLMQRRLNGFWTVRMRRVETVGELENVLSTMRDSLVALVPTMGALHAGHRALVEQARALAPTVVLSIFVNPLQFGDEKDFARYPRNLAEDELQARDFGVDVLWTPSEEIIYPPGYEIARIDAGELGNQIEGAIRPGHFSGVLTVVARLFDVVHPDVAVFGEKDRQQLELIKRMSKGRPEIVGVPIVREEDGLALSSRNQFLSQGERQSALHIYRAIQTAQNVGREGMSAVTDAVANELSDLDVEYADVVDAKSWAHVTGEFTGEAILLIAAKIGSIHMIDNGKLRIG